MAVPGITAAPLLINPGTGGSSIEDLFNISLWTGTGAARTITTGIDSGEGSLVWIKSINDTTDNILYDTIRGTSSSLSSNLSSQAAPVPSRVTAFSASSYSLGADDAVNKSGVSFVGWQFRKAEKFFDIVQYTGNGVSGRSIPHSLGSVPGMIIIKKISSAENWIVYHKSVGATKYAFLNGAQAFNNDENLWNNTEPTSASFTVSAFPYVNQNAQTYIGYIVSSEALDGDIQCGSYVGNGSATGPVVNLGWRPQFLLFKSSTSSESWWIRDDYRSGLLRPNFPNAEEAGSYMSFNSTGFQPITTNSLANGNGQTYIYMAIREA